MNVDVDFTSPIRTAVSSGSMGAAVVTAVAPPDLRAVSAGRARQLNLAAEMPAPDGVDVAMPPGPLLDGRYRLTALLGQGSSGAVYRGTDLRLQRPVAVKIFHDVPTELVAAARQRNEMLFLD